MSDLWSCEVSWHLEVFDGVGIDLKPNPIRHAQRLPLMPLLESKNMKQAIPPWSCSERSRHFGAVNAHAFLLKLVLLVRGMRLRVGDVNYEWCEVEMTLWGIRGQGGGKG